MKRALNYAIRIVACIYLLCSIMIATNTIGKPSSGEPMTWESAWLAIAFIALTLWIGYQAGRESREPKP